MNIKHLCHFTCLFFLLGFNATVYSQTSPNAHDHQQDEHLEKEGTQPEAKTASDQTPLPLDQIRAFSEAFVRIKQAYVEEVTDEELLDLAIEGMLNGLDPHSAFLRAEDYEEFREQSSGKFGGLGLEVMKQDGFVSVISPIDDTPAQEAGIQTGDLIIRVDDQLVTDMSLREATDLMRGDPGSEVTLTIIRGESGEPFDVTLERAIIKVKTVRGKRLEDKFAYIRITQFQATTSELVRKRIKQLQVKAPIEGLVLDLRNNPGGLLNSAVSIADLFIKSGRIVSTKRRDPEEGYTEKQEQSYDATPYDILDGAPIVVLINGGSASASEIVAGALQDHRRGVLLGTQSFGKGSVQTVINLQNNDAIKLTTSRYYTPNGHSIQAVGITPDIIAKPRSFNETEEARGSFYAEKSLAKHLDNEDKTLESKGSKDSEKNKAPIKDYQLNEALNLMKGLVILKASPDIEAAELKHSGADKPN